MSGLKSARFGTASPGRSPGPVGCSCKWRRRATPADDVTALWREGRPLVELGRLEVTGISPTSAADERRLIFDPTNRTDGIDLSADPILLARSAAYAISYDRRSKGE
jgi:catalase